MKQFMIRYESQDGDYCKAWVEAEDRDQAEDIFFEEYWDCSEILSIEEM